MLRKVWPTGIPAESYGAAVVMVLEVVGWEEKPPRHQRVGLLVGDMLKARGPMTYAQLQEATRLSVGAVANGLKACGAVVVRQSSNGKSGKGSKPINWYGLPGVHGEEIRHG